MDKVIASSRQIQHIVPDDGTEHVPVECYCHPDICEANAWSAIAGLEDVDVPQADEGALIFTHHKAAETSRWTINVESDDDEAQR